MFQKLLLKSALFRTIFRAMFPQETAGDVVDAATSRFDAITAEQDAIEQAESTKIAQAEARRNIAKQKRESAEKASRNFRNMLEAD